MAGGLSLAVRTVHVLAMAVLLGGITVVWAGLRSRADLELARRFEWAFWASVGVVVLTGVGNLGALGAPGPETDWGTVLTGKLVLVAVLLVGSIVRTLAVVRAEEREIDDENRRLLERAYAATGLTVLAVVVLAEVLAHG